MRMYFLQKSPLGWPQNSECYRATYINNYNYSAYITSTRV